MGCLVFWQSNIDNVGPPERLLIVVVLVRLTHICWSPSALVFISNTHRLSDVSSIRDHKRAKRRSAIGWGPERL